MKETTNKPGPLGIAAGTVQGREHARAGRNNQDAFAVHTAGDVDVAIVCDGCGSAPFSETGAQIMSRWLAHHLARQDWRKGRAAEILAVAQALLIQQLQQLADGLGARKRIAHDYFLATILGAVVRGPDAWVFGLGDGVLLLNDEKVCIEFPGNAPPYLGYALMGQPVPPFTLHASPESGDLDRILIASDGAEEIDRLQTETLPGTRKPMHGLTQFVDDEVYYRSPPALTRRLRLMNRNAVDPDEGFRVPGRLGDDTTIVAIRREA